MLIYAILKILLRFGSAITNWIGGFGAPQVNFSWVDDFINSIDIAFYLFPLYALEPLLIVIIVFTVLRIGIAIAKFLFDAIPLY